jgi:hypothetical protein
MIIYSMKKDNSSKSITGNKNYYITANYPYNFLTENMTFKQAVKLMYSMRQLGLYVIVDESDSRNTRP